MVSFFARYALASLPVLDIASVLSSRDGRTNPALTAAELQVMSSRFTAPVKPGNELETSVWFTGEKDGVVEIAFEQTVVGGKKSLGGGYAKVKRGTKPATFKL